MSPPGMTMTANRSTPMTPKEGLEIKWNAIKDIIPCGKYVLKWELDTFSMWVAIAKGICQDEVVEWKGNPADEEKGNQL